MPPRKGREQRGGGDMTSAEQERVLAAEEDVLEAFAACSPKIRQRIIDCMMSAPIGSMSPQQCGNVSAFTHALARLSTALRVQESSTELAVVERGVL
jgi:hypothetical protein